MGYYNPYSPLLLSHQTGLSGTPSTGSTWITVGSPISIPRNGILSIFVIAHVSADEGYIQVILTRNGTNYYFGDPNGPNSTFGNTGNYDTMNYIYWTSPWPQSATGSFGTATGSSGLSPSFIIPVLANDSIQFKLTNNTANETTYLDDATVILI